jgi:transketolase
MAGGEWGYAGRNIHFGIREHAMTAILTGMAHHGGVIPFGATFLTFSDYMRPSIRLAALSEAHVIYVWTHDSIALGEDGPTHQPVEQIASLRAMPNMLLLRPADANETVEAWRIALRHTGGPVGLVLTRQKLPVLDRTTLVLPPGVTARVSIEAASSFGWERYVGLAGAMIGVDRFGASATGSVVMAHYGFTMEHVVATAKAVLGR